MPDIDLAAIRTLPRPHEFDQPTTEHGPQQRTAVADGQGQAEPSRREPEVAQGEGGQHDAQRTAQPHQVARPGRERQGPQRPVAEDEPQPLGDLRAHPGLLPGRGHLHSRQPDEAQEQRGHQVAHRVDHQDQRRGDRLEEQTAEAGTGQFRGRAGELQPAVAVRGLLPGHHGRQEGLVRDVEEHRAQADGEADRTEQGHAQQPGEVADRQQRDGRGPPDVGRHHHPPHGPTGRATHPPGARTGGTARSPAPI